LSTTQATRAYQIAGRLKALYHDAELLKPLSEPKNRCGGSHNKKNPRRLRPAFGGLNLGALLLNQFHQFVQLVDQKMQDRKKSNGTQGNL
jgi:hypothetical protein